MRALKPFDTSQKPSPYSRIIIVILISVVSLALYKFISERSREGAPIITGYSSGGRGTDAEYYSTLNLLADPDPQLCYEKALSDINGQEIAGQSGIIVNISSGKILFEKNSTEKMKIASLTKVMTAVVVLEHADLEAEVKISANAAGIGENSMGISEGETYTYKELLYGLLLPSGNDAAYALAEGVAGDSETFVKWMNIKARQLNLQNTSYFDPSGLDDNTYSTAEDLVKLTQYALKSKDFREIVKTSEIELTGEKHKYIYLENQTNLLKTYPGVEGVKTGFTEEAGLCLITYARNDCVDVVGVVLNSIDRKGDMILMLDYGYKSIGINIEHHLLDY